MVIELLTRRELEIINKRTLKYPLAVAEKDYFLAIVTKIIYESPLKNKLVFKGGTAIHHCYLPQLRFSEDLDFTSLDKEITIDEIRKVLLEHDFFTIKKDFVSDATIKIERLLYTGPLNQTNSIKIEIDHKQNVVLPAVKMAFNNPWRIDSECMVMDVSEICAEKIRAINERARYRDFYDLCMILETYKLSLKDVLKLLSQKEQRKKLSPDSILQQWQIAKEEKQGELTRIYFTKEAATSDIEKMLKEIVTLI